MKIEMHRPETSGVQSLMYVGDAGDGMGAIDQPDLVPWMVLGGVLLALGWLAGEHAKRKR